VTAIVVRADARSLPLPDDSVDLIVTSPPYYALRDYRDGDGSLAGQIGAEPTPAEYVTALLECTREWMRVLKPSGSMWINLGDRYSQRVATRPSSQQDGLFPDRPELAKDWKRDRARGLARMPYENIIDPSTGTYVPEKSLIGLPWRYALGCLDGLGLILRAEVLWSKPNGLPESVTDRVRRSHEQFFHFTKQPRYYSAVDEIREPHAGEFLSSGARNARHKHGGRLPHEITSTYLNNNADRKDGGNVPGNRNPLGKLPGSVWEIATQPLKVPEHLAVDHFAAFPPALVRQIVLGWSPPGICTACGEGRRPIFDRAKVGGWTRHTTSSRLREGSQSGGNEIPGRQVHHHVEVTRTGYACACSTPDAPTRPSVVVDPFGGTGTTALVATVHGRIGVSCDLSHDYGRLARWRTTDPGERARALGVPKPPPVTTGQGDLFADEVIA
jgi:DNA modification methylase